jgi:hypothetical protein
MHMAGAWLDLQILQYQLRHHMLQAMSLLLQEAEVQLVQEAQEQRAVPRKLVAQAVREEQEVLEVRRILVDLLVL